MGSELIIMGSQQYYLWQPEAVVFLDQSPIGKVSLRDHVSFDILSGKHMLYLKWGAFGIQKKSNTILFKINDNESITVLFSVNRWTSDVNLTISNVQLLIDKEDVKPTNLELHMSETFNNNLSNANIANLANKISDNALQLANQNIYTFERKQMLSEAAAEIQKLLKHLEINNPAASEAEKITYVNDETTPSFKRRVAGALQAGGEAAIEEFLDSAYVNVGKAIVKGWIKPE